MRFPALLAFLYGGMLFAGALSARAQVGGSASKPVGEGSGPVSELSVPLGDGSRPVHERGRTVREGSLGPMKSGPVRDAGTRSMKSGPVSELSRGPVTEGRAMSGSGSIGASSAGAVTKDLASPLGERISDPFTELVPLQDILRQRAATAGQDAAAADPPAIAADGAGPDTPDQGLPEAEAAFDQPGEPHLAEEPLDPSEDGPPPEKE